MWFEIIFVAMLSYIQATEAKSVSTKCTRPAIEWKIDWSKQPTNLDIFNEIYQSQGEIVSDVYVSEIVELLGMAWKAESFLEIDGLICLQYGPILNVLAGNDIVRGQCDDTMAALRGEKQYDLEDICNEAWNTFPVDQMVQPLIPNIGCNFTYDYDVVCQFDDVIIAYTHDIVEKASELIFHVLAWLGPSPFSGDVFGACSGLRRFLRMDLNDVATDFKSVLTFPIADFLEYFREVSPCKSQNNIVAAVRDIIVLLTEMDQSSLCSFISATHTREEYLNLASVVADTLFTVPDDKTLCNSVLHAVSPFVDSNIIYQITSYNITLPSDLSMLCANITESFSQRSTFTPSPYILPSEFNSDSWTPFATPGEILPKYFFYDAVTVTGAIFRSDTLIQGASLVCTEFESAINEISAEVGSYVSDTCRDIRDGNTAEIERTCLKMTVPLQYGEQYPISVRSPTEIYMAVIGVDIARKLFNISKISQAEVCKATDEFYYSNNLESVVRLSLNAYLTEFLPIADNICKDYNNVICSLGPGCESPVSTDQERFENTVKDISKVIFSFLGVSNRQELCDQISSGIDSSSGAANIDLVSEIESASLLLLTNHERCLNVTDISLSMIELYIPDGNVQDELYLYTGYTTSKDMCTQLTSAFKCSGALPMQISYILVMCITCLQVVKIYIFGS